MIYVYVIIGILVIAVFYNYYQKQSTLSSILNAVSETDRLRLESRKFLSTHSGKTPPTAAILSTTSNSTVLTLSLTKPIGDIPSTGYKHTFSAASSENIANYREARTAEVLYATSKIQEIEKHINSPDSIIQNLAKQAIFDIRSKEIYGDCSNNDCDFPCDMDCGFGDCGVCGGCGCSDTYCCPASPPGWPQRCGGDEAAMCAALVIFLGGFKAMCAAGPADAAFVAICDGAAEAVPAIGAVCSIFTGVGLGIACAYNDNQLEQLISKGVGCTC